LFSTDFERSDGIEEITLWRLVPDGVRGLIPVAVTN
jgi:hypothetical protein